MARKGKPWGPSNPLWRWQHRRGGGKKRRTEARTQARGTKMARRRYYGRRRRRGGMKLPIISLGILGMQVVAARAYGGGDIPHTINEFQKFYTGFDAYDQLFHPDRLLVGYGPWAAKWILTKFVKPGRALGRMGLPVSLS